MKLLELKITAIITILILTLSSGAQEYSDVEIKSIKITNKIYMLQGKGGNIGLFAGRDGIFMIDDQFAPLTYKIKSAVLNISSKPIKFVVNTHWHGDHTGGNENFSQMGAVIVAHENVRKRMSTEQFIKLFDRVVPPSVESALPIITFSNNVTFHLDEEEIEVFHVNSAHTDGDSIIHFKDSNVLHMGDTFFAGRYPFIDISSGGSVSGMIDAAGKVLDMVDDDTKIIPGHGPLTDKNNLRDYIYMLKNSYSQTKKYFIQQKSLDAIIESDILKDSESKYGGSSIDREKFLKIIYNDLENKHLLNQTIN